jgi:hypothetical protein
VTLDTPTAKRRIAEHRCAAILYKPMDTKLHTSSNRRAAEYRFAAPVYIEQSMVWRAAVSAALPLHQCLDTLARGQSKWTKVSAKNYLYIHSLQMDITI